MLCLQAQLQTISPPKPAFPDFSEDYESFDDVSEGKDTEAVDEPIDESLHPFEKFCRRFERHLALYECDSCRVLL
jgi:hypothetical protein